MGHKVHPYGFRLGVYKGWEANWFALPKDYRKMLQEDLEMRGMITGQLKNAGISKIETERSSSNQLTITIHTAKPGIVIGKQGASVDHLRNTLEKRFHSRMRISIQEIKQPELNAQLVAESVASQIERRIAYRRAMKQAVLRTMRAGAQGVRIAVAGRLRGAEMARREWTRQGRVPLHTLRANIDFGRTTSKTTFGSIGVKVWIYTGLLAIESRVGAPDAAPLPPIEATAPAAPTAIPEPPVPAAPASAAQGPAAVAEAKVPEAVVALEADPAAVKPGRRPAARSSKAKAVAATPEDGPPGQAAEQAAPPARPRRRSPIVATETGEGT